MSELYLKDDELIAESEWRKIILDMSNVKELSESTVYSKIRMNLEKAIISRAKQGKNIGVMFSGGIDSSSIAYFLRKHRIKFKAFSIGFYQKNIEGIKDPEDIVIGEKLIAEWKMKYFKKILNLASVKKEMKYIVKLLGWEIFDVPNVEVGIVEDLCMKTAKAEGCDLVFSGIGSEELFAGYQRHTHAKDVNKECINGLIDIYRRDLLRLNRIGYSNGISVATPFLDREMIRVSMQVKNGLKIKEGFSKHCLRKALEKEEIPEEIVWRKKKAAQYGSRIDSAIVKLSRRAGFKFKKEYLRGFL